MTCNTRHPLREYPCVVGCHPFLFAFAGPDEISNDSLALGLCMYYVSVELGWSRPLRAPRIDRDFHLVPPHRMHCCHCLNSYYIPWAVAVYTQQSVVRNYCCLFGLHPLWHCYSGPDSRGRHDLGCSVCCHEFNVPPSVVGMCPCLFVLGAGAGSFQQYTRDGQPDFFPRPPMMT